MLCDVHVKHSDVMPRQSPTDTTNRHEITEIQHTGTTPLAHNQPQPRHKTNRTHTHPSIASVYPWRGKMHATDPQGSPSERGGGGSSTPPLSDRSGGSSSTPPGAGSQPEVIGRMI